MIRRPGFTHPILWKTSLHKTKCKKTDDSTIVIEGVVFDEKKEPMIGVIIQLFDGEKNIGTAAADIDGCFLISCTSYKSSSQLTMRIHYVSYKTFIVKIDIANIEKSYTITMQRQKRSDEIILGYAVPLIDRFEPNKTIIRGEQIDKMAR